MRLLHTSFGIQKTGWITEEKVIQPALFWANAETRVCCGRTKKRPVSSITLIPRS